MVKCQRKRVYYAEHEKEDQAQHNQDFERRVGRREKVRDRLNCWVWLLSVLNLSCCAREHLDFIRTKHDTHTHAEPQARFLFHFLEDCVDESEEYVEDDTKAHFPVHLILGRVHLNFQRVSKPRVLVPAPHLIQAFKRLRPDT